MIPTAVCRHDGSPAVAVVETPSGCVAFPEDRQQFLCAQHVVSVWDGTGGDFEAVMALPGMERWL